VAAAAVVARVTVTVTSLNTKIRSSPVFEKKKTVAVKLPRLCTIHNEFWDDTAAVELNVAESGYYLSTCASAYI